MWRFTCVVVWSLIALLISESGLCVAGDPVSATVLFKNAQILDGSGSAAVVGNVAISKGQVVAVGDFDVAGTPWVLDCTGLIVCPGFIDLHNHSDRPIVEPRTRGAVNYLMQGCTTIVTGNCGAGPTDADKLYQAVDDQGAGVNVAHLIPQGAVRDEILGNVNRVPSREELSRMQKLCEKGMRDGCWGISTGLIYVPSGYAQTDELVALSQVVASQGGIYVSHMRDEGSGLMNSVKELLEIGRRANIPVHASHFKASGQEAWGLTADAARYMEEARKLGIKVTADQYPYNASSTSLEATVIPKDMREGDRKEFVKRLEAATPESALWKVISSEIAAKDRGKEIRFARYDARPDWIGRTLADVAESEKKDPVLIVVETSKAGGASIVNFGMNEQEVRDIMALDWVATASDGRAEIPNIDKPHPRSYGTFSRKIGFYALREKIISLEHAVRSATGLPADILGLSNPKRLRARVVEKGQEQPADPWPRGYLKPGFAADIAVFDPEKFVDQATFNEPHRYSAGLRYVFVNGEPAVFEGIPTGAFPGVALRNRSNP